jgi:uncharacterized protein YeaO (DUF488 family)
MKIYTSYFSKMGSIPIHMVPVSIALYPPKGWYSSRYRALAPEGWLLKKFKEDGDKEFYETEFMKQLDSLDFDGVYAKLLAFGGGYDVVLLCYERPENFCHRHLVRKWLAKHGIKSEEWTIQ